MPIAGPGLSSLPDRKRTEPKRNMKADPQRSHPIPVRRTTIVKALLAFSLFGRLTFPLSFAQSPATQAPAPVPAQVRSPASAQGSTQAASKSLPGSSEGMTLEQFRGAVAAHAAEAMPPKFREKAPPPDLRAADELFLQLLLAQANEAAIRQSLDRLSGWRKSIESRFQTQNVPELDLDTIKFAEAKRTVEAARADVELKRILEHANAMMGHAPASSFQALLPIAADDPPSAIEKQEKDLLGQGEELIIKQFKNYQFGGIDLGALLGQEQQLYQTELEYRGGVARDAIPTTAVKPAGGR